MEETRQGYTRHQGKTGKRALLQAAREGLSTLAVIFLLPLSLMAMTPVTDSTLSDITGQSGVSINADLTMNFTIDTIAWGDADGIGGFNSGSDTSPWATVSSGGYIGLTHNIVTGLRIKPRETDSYNGYSSSSRLKPITIDVATGTKLGVANTTFVRLGTGSLQISAAAMSRTIEFGQTSSLGQVLGTQHGGDMNVYYNPESYVDIWAHSGCGVNIELNLVLDEFDIVYASWGDSDGLPSGNPGNAGGIGDWVGSGGSSGYVGVHNLLVGGPLWIRGTVAIDVVTIAAGQGTYAGLGLNPVLGQFKDTTVVHINLPTNVNLHTTGPITCSVRLDATPSLNSSTYRTLYDYYASQMDLTIVQGSWLDIWAH